MFIQGNPRSIIILRALQLGDLICTVPAFRALRAACPDARITLVGLPWADGFVQRFSAYLDEFIEFPGWPGLPERDLQAEVVPTFLKKIQQRNFDLAIQMQGSGYLTNPVVSLFKARQTAGFFQPGQYQPEKSTFFPYPEGEHEIHIFLKLMKHLGIPSQGEDLEFPVSPKEQQDFLRLQRAYSLVPQNYVCLHPGARDAKRRWRPEKFAATGDTLARLGLQVVLTGTQSERSLTEAVAQHMRFPAVDLAGKTNMGSLALLIGSARLLVSNDTGVSHLAAALHVPSIILFNASEPGRWRPLDHHLHRVVLNAQRATPKDVIAEAQPFLAGLKRLSPSDLSRLGLRKSAVQRNPAERVLLKQEQPHAQ
jgi:ADP-heptose:LPS heptosyltransferase